MYIFFEGSVVAREMAALSSISSCSSQFSVEKQFLGRNTENFSKLFLTTTGASNEEI